MRHTILFFLFLSFLFGCSNKESQDKKERNEKAITELIEQTDAIQLDDNLNNYSFTFYEKFVVQNKTMAFEGDISDVSIVDSSYPSV